MTFPQFPKIPRWNREVVLTEKLDGTNGLVAVVLPDQSVDATISARRYRVLSDGTVVAAGSRKRWLNPNDDNFGFAQWVWDHAEELAQLGPGKHYGEWYGKGIQRGYGLPDRRFALFNVTRWHPAFPAPEGKEKEKPPDCVEVVTVLATCLADELAHVLPSRLDMLRDGSAHVPGFPNAEGVVLYHTAGNHLYKITFEGDRAKTPDGYVIRPTEQRYTGLGDQAAQTARTLLQNWANKSFSPPAGVLTGAAA